MSPVHFPKVRGTDMVTLCGLLVVPSVITVDTHMVTCKRCKRCKVYAVAREAQEVA